MDVEVVITFSNGENIVVDKNCIIFPIQLVERNGEKHTSKNTPVLLDEYSHHHDGYIPVLTSIFSSNEFFTVDEEDYFRTKVYMTSSIVSLEQREI
ncbi:hypothetical protein B4065_0155 [Caldibacillus thermoamylovorans]|uniref:hypothetical protein n=1 Tax=Caldibacillus thermoamylovorans TaxID=35841 RepID=UPI0005A47069|nr:hypothetical protein [Caldibacillus thermoamylovorans]KIO60229.1 hypothetical protein B4065_0155 [Caldibacillus thermoamylovorans]